MLHKVVPFLALLLQPLVQADGHGGANETTSMVHSFTGYLADMLCTRLEIAPDAANMILNPFEHTVRCQLLPACIRSGYGLVQNIGSSGENLYRVAATFDEPGSDYVADLLMSMDSTINDLRVKVQGTFTGLAPATETPAITSRDGERSWPAMNEIPTISIDSLEFCNYEGPDARMFIKDICSTDSILELLSTAAGRDILAGANLCMRDEIAMFSSGDSYLVNPDGCADHATFRDVKRADQQSCSQTVDSDCDGTCDENVDTCARECVDACGNALQVDISGRIAKTCCLDACGNPIVDPCGFPFYDACGNPTTADGTMCPATNVAENQVNDCLDVCGNPVVDACGNPVTQCCLDECGNPLLDPCGFPFLDPCGNPALTSGETCPTGSLGANVCLPSESVCEGEQCALECVDACGNPLVLSSGRAVSSCCLDACGNPIVDPCGFPFYDVCGNPTLSDGMACPANSVAENEINECVDACGNPFADACGNPIDTCCIDACGNPIVDTCGNPVLDPCGNPLTAVGGSVCPANQVGQNACKEGGKEMCETECVDACGNPFADACGNPINSCCIDPCGNPVTDPCGNPILDPCGNPLTAVGGSLCPAEQLRQNSCDGGSSTTGGSSWRNRNLSSSNSPRKKSNNKIGSKHQSGKKQNRAIRRTLIANHNKIVMMGAQLENNNNRKRKLTGHEGGACHRECVDVCGNPLARDISGRPAKTCCLDACGNPLLDGCGFPFYDACGNPTSGYSGEACPLENIGELDINECVDVCGNPVVDACGNPSEHCCLDACGNPQLDSSGFPFLDACGNPADANGNTCTTENIGQNACPSGYDNTSGCATGCVDVCGNPLVNSNGRTARNCCLDDCGSPLVDPCGFPFVDACGNPTTADGTACPASMVATNDVNDCLDACGSPLVDVCGNPVGQCCLDPCGNPLVDPCGIPYLDACGNPALASGETCPTGSVGENVCTDDGDSSGDCTPVSVFPPAAGSFQCQGLVSPCQLAGNQTNTEVVGVPQDLFTQRRKSRSRRMQGEPSVPLYTPLSKDIQIKIPTTPSMLRMRRDLNPDHAGVIGVAVNGVPIVYEHPGEGANTLLFDSCGGHADLVNRYHYHLPPICLLRSLGGTVPRVSDWWLAPNPEAQWPSHAKPFGEASPLVGWTIDGSPIFGPYNPDNGELVVASGAAAGDAECSTNVLDECNGMVLENGVYAYFLTPTAPFVPPCLMGNVPPDAFVDNGLKDGVVSQCPFEGTNPLAGTEICEEKTILFEDATCPGNADRQKIRNCFELATSSFVGEPSCAQMQDAIAESASCFLEVGCCQDLEATISVWMQKYPALEACRFTESGCIAFEDDNVLSITIQIDSAVGDLVADTRSLLRKTVATSLGVETSQARVESITGTETSSQVVFHIAYPTRDDAMAAVEAIDFDALTSNLQQRAGVTTLSVEADHMLPPVIPDLWSTNNRWGLGLSMTAVLVLFAILVYFEDIFCVPTAHDEPKEDERPEKPTDV